MWKIKSRNDHMISFRYVIGVNKCSAYLQPLVAKIDCNSNNVLIKTNWFYQQESVAKIIEYNIYKLYINVVYQAWIKFKL